jgi:hypothetical protein
MKKQQNSIWKLKNTRAAAADIYAEGCEVVDAVEFFDAMYWIARQPRSVHDQLVGMQKISALDGKVSSYPEFARLQRTPNYIDRGEAHIGRPSRGIGRRTYRSRT